MYIKFDLCLAHPFSTPALPHYIQSPPLQNNYLDLPLPLVFKLKTADVVAAITMQVMKKILNRLSLLHTMCRDVLCFEGVLAKCRLRGCASSTAVSIIGSVSSVGSDTSAKLWSRTPHQAVLSESCTCFVRADRSFIFTT